MKLKIPFMNKKQTPEVSFGLVQFCSRLNKNEDIKTCSIPYIKLFLTLAIIFVVIAITPNGLFVPAMLVAGFFWRKA